MHATSVPAEHLATLMTESIIQNVRFDERGLIPAVLQDATTNEVLALCYMDNKSLAATLQTGSAVITLDPGFDSEALPHRLVDVRVNADGGLLTVLVERAVERTQAQETVSLVRDFSAQAKASADVSLVDVQSMEFGLAMNKLYSLIAQRKENRPEGSYTTYLFNSGLDKILKKIAEEAGEVIIASKNRSPSELVSELSDLFYHLLVLMVEREVSLSDVHNELSRRAGASPIQSDDTAGHPDSGVR